MVRILARMKEMINMFLLLFKMQIWESALRTFNTRNASKVEFILYGYYHRCYSFAYLTRIVAVRERPADTLTVE